MAKVSWADSDWLQVPPDFYVPDFDEDENPDERINRKPHQAILYTTLPFVLIWLLVILLFWISCSFCEFEFPEHTQDKLIQRDDEYYDGDQDNDHNMDDI